AGFRDGYFHPLAQEALAVPLGVEMVGDPVEPILVGALDLAGRARRDYPLAGNRGGRTAGVVQVAAPNDLGHDVIVNETGPRYQYTCFLASVGAASGAVIAAPDEADGPCPQ